MIISLVLIFIISAGGMALTYLAVDDESFMWRAAAGCIAGSALFGLVVFILALAAGLTPAGVVIAAAVTAAPAALMLSPKFGSIFRHDWAKAKGKFQGFGLKRFEGFAYYLFFLVLFWLFFGQAMYETPQGIFTGGTQNLGDLPFHLGAIFSFTDGNNFPPQNPSFAGARFSYPFIADLVTAAFIKLGADVKGALFVQNVAWAFSLVILLERLTVRLTGSKLAGRLAPFLLIFSGGLGFGGFFMDYWSGGRSLWDTLWNLSRDYTIGDNYRWGNSMVVLFITQRSILLGMPLTIMVLGFLWRVFSWRSTEDAADVGASDDADRGQKKQKRGNTDVESGFLASAKPLFVGLLAGCLPLIHLHSLAVLFIVTVFLFIFRPAKWMSWMLFGVGVCIVAIPELLWSMSGTATETSKFFGWNLGWDKRDNNVFWFWLKNTGLVIPVIGLGIYLILSRRTSEQVKPADNKVSKATARSATGSMPAELNPKALLLFYVPFAAIFIIANIFKLAPWEWDNIKVLIYWFVGSIPMIAYALAWAWKHGTAFRIAAAAVFLSMTMAGSIDIWRTASGQVKAKVFDADAVKVAEQIKQRTPPNALFLNAPTYNSAVVLSGRPSFMRYSGHLSSHGIDYMPREEEVKTIYRGGGMSDAYLRDAGIQYVLVSPEERSSLQAKDETFAKYPVAAESGAYKVYKIK